MRRMPRLALAIVVAAACSTPPPSPALPNGGPVYKSFENASAAAGVPLDVLLAVGWVQSRWSVPDPAAVATSDGNASGDATGDTGSEHAPAYGIMQLTDISGHDTLGLGAELLGVDRELVKTDLDTNLLAAAAVLRHYAEETFGSTDQVDAADLDEWRDVVARFASADDPELGISYSSAVWQSLHDGASRTLESGEVIELEGQDVTAPAPSMPDQLSGGAFGTLQQRLSADYGGVAHVRPSPNFTAGRDRAIDMVVIHDTEGGYEGSISWLDNPAAQASAQYILRSSDGEITQMVSESDAAWHSGNHAYNHRSIGIEHEGFMSTPAYYTETMYRASAKLVCDITRRHHIPIDREHIIGHAEVPDPFHPGQFGGSGGHRDPGPYWDWPHYISLIKAECNDPSSDPTPPAKHDPTPPAHGNATIDGIVYQAPDKAHRLPGAHVTLSDGQTRTTDANGFWSATVAPGRHVVNVSAQGYASGSAMRDCTQGGTVWASVGLDPDGTDPAQGTVSGFVYIAPDANRRLPGASVRVGSHDVSTDALGRYSVRVAVGDQTVVVSHDGFEPVTLQRKVAAGKTTTVEVGLAPVNAKGTLEVTVADAATGKVVGGARVTLSDGSAATANGQGVATFNVNVGQYRINATASGYSLGTAVRAVQDGQKTPVRVLLAAAAGQGKIVGVVFQSPDPARRIAGATLTTDRGPSATANAKGVYELSLAAGNVIITASADGYLPKSLVRRATAGATVWASVGLLKGTNDNGVITERVTLVAPANNGSASSNPDFSWNASPTGQKPGYAYHALVMDADDPSGDVFERDVTSSAGGVVHATLGLALKSGHWSWGVYVIRTSDKSAGPLSDLNVFTVN